MRDQERELLQEYKNKLAEWEAKAATAQGMAERYRLAVRGLEAVLSAHEDGGPASQPSTTGTPPTEEDRAESPMERPVPAGPRGEEAVRRLLETNPGRAYTVSEIHAALDDRGWLNPDAKNPKAATRAATYRLRDKDPRIVHQDGRFQFKASSANPFVGDQQPLGEP